MGMGVAKTGDGDAGEKIQVDISGLGKQFTALAVTEYQISRWTVVRPEGLPL
jgi:hypothetical protein